MASSSSSTTTGSAPVVSTRRKMEVLGLVLMVLALLLSLAFLTYQPADDPVAQSAPLLDALLHPSQYNSVGNALGLLGAELARALVPGFLGYSILFYSLALMVWGYAVFRHWTLRPLLYPTGLILLSAFVTAALIGWFAHTFSTNLVRWAGAVGMGTAGWMQGVFGQTGSFILILLVVAVMLMLVVDHDIQRSVDRVIESVQHIEAKIQSGWAAGQDWIERKRREREEKKKKQARAEQDSSAPTAEEAPTDTEAPSKTTESSSTTSSHSPSDGAETDSADEPSDADQTDEEEESSPPEASSDAEQGDEPESVDDESTDDEDAGRPSITVQVPENAGDGRPLRRNDLFRDRLVDAAEDQPDADEDDDSSDELDLEELEEEFGEAFEETTPPPDETDEPDSVHEEEKPSSPEPDEQARSDEDGSASPDEGDRSVSVEEADASTPSEPAPSPAPDAEADEAEADEQERDASPEPAEPISEEPASAESDEHSAKEAAADTELSGLDAEAIEEAAEEASGASASSASDEEQPEASSPSDDVELTVQERVEEETADEIARPAETPEEVEYESPPLNLLEEPTDDDPSVNRDELEKNKRILLDKLDTYNVEIDDISAVVGPTVTRYELTPAPGVKVSRIKSLEDDLAMAMAASGVRMLAPIPGKSAIGVEIPNSNRELVRLREIIGTAKFRDTDMTLPLPMGKSIEGEVFLADLTKMPHLLIAGATGSGKSVGLNSIITGLIYACHPMNLRFVVIDPKKIELQQYTALDTQFVAQPQDVDQTVITDIEEASGVLKSVEKEMEERYDLLSDAKVRGIDGYNEKFKAGELSPEDGHRHMPYIVVVVDELADLMMAVGDDIEGPISRLAQMARAVGIHLILATQRPSVDVITGVIKANFPSRIAYEVASMADSRTILDQGGAEGLVGNGDMLFLSGSDMRRLQGPFVSVEEVEEVVDHVAEQPGVTPYELPSLMDAGHGPSGNLGVDDTDEKFEEAARVTVRRQQGSVSLLQRKLAVGYTRAARIVDQLEEAGIVGPHNGTKAREVLVEDEQELERLMQGEDVNPDE